MNKTELLPYRACKLEARLVGRTMWTSELSTIDLGLTLDPPQSGNVRYYDCLYLMRVVFRNKSKCCWGYGHLQYVTILRINILVYVTLTHQCINVASIHETFTCLRTSHLTTYVR